MTYLIAEAGTNFCHPDPVERLKRALSLVDAAPHADAVKFQMFVSDEPLFCPVDGDDKRWARWNNTLMDFDIWLRVKLYCEKKGIDFLASAFQPTAVSWLKELDVKYYKVASRAAKKYPYTSVPGPFIASNGMGDTFTENVITLQCCMKYPTPLGEAVWRGMTQGLSDHSGTVFPGLDAMAYGAGFLEVHFNIDGFDAGPDEPVCLTVDQLKFLCEARDAFREMQ